MRITRKYAEKRLKNLAYKVFGIYDVDRVEEIFSLNRKKIGFKII